VNDLMDFGPHEEPTADDLAAIERESGLIAAEMDLLDAEIRLVEAGRGTSELDRRRLRRAERRVERESAELLRHDRDDHHDYPAGDAA
jgi:hypothetical protein